jgi:hypothetical protein
MKKALFGVLLSRSEVVSKYSGVLAVYCLLYFLLREGGQCLTVDRLTQVPFAGRRCQVSQNCPGACSLSAIGCLAPRAPLARPEALAGAWLARA